MRALKVFVQRNFHLYRSENEVNFFQVRSYFDGFVLYFNRLKLNKIIFLLPNK